MSLTTSAAPSWTVPEETRALCDRARRFADEADPWPRALLATRIYREHGDWPAVRLRAEVLAQALETIAPAVLPGERVVGLAFRRSRVHGGVGDHDLWRNRCRHPEHHGFSPSWPVPAEVAAELSWWQGRALHPWSRNPARERQRWVFRHGLAHPVGFVGGHTLPDHGLLLTAGIAGLRRQIATRRARPCTPQQTAQLLAMDRCLEGLSAHARLCAAAARQAAREQTGVARANLLAAAERCEAVATAPPAGFAEALQLLHLSNTADTLDSPGDACSFGRIDQLLAPYLEADLAAGRLTEADAFDLVCHFLIKKWACQTSNNLTVGGVTPAGGDATNRLTYWFLEAMEATGMVANLSVRLHQGSPARLWSTAVRVARLGLGRPSLYHDDVVIPALVRTGVALEDARDYAPLGCVEVMIPGRTSHRTMCGGVNLPKILELVLHGGRCPVTGDQVWDDVPNDFPTFEALLAEHHRRLWQVADAVVEVINEDERIEPQIFPRPWLTVLSRGGVEDARDLTDGQPRYDPLGVTVDGLADVANALAAVRHLVYESRRLSLAELREVLAADWAGAEDLAAYVVRRLPRFGNDEPAVDALAAGEAAAFAAAFADRRSLHGGPYWPMIFGVSTSMLQGAAPQTGATAGGRRRGETLAMSLQPASRGPRGPLTAVLRSAAAIDGLAFPGGISNVQECDPSLFTGDDGLDRLSAIVRGFFDLGGVELSLNFLDEATLRAAQAHPEQHGQLMVRLFGLSARFVDLSPAVQESVIERVRAAAGRC